MASLSHPSLYHLLPLRNPLINQHPTLAIKVLQLTVMSTAIPIEVEVVHIAVVVDVEDIPINEPSPITISNGSPMIPVLDAKFAMAAIILPTLVINATTTHPILLQT
ncbi:hypothetical protein EJD97_007751 [Solanum chilense]|uniref:Uncharacterized protein n=1 Tax=Solanum chilense TaxID=4083 RepID=A0A6N2BRA6_SOLCI|nr:hypothetical protein EJD97_007751 [Solanum chilense]